MNMGRFSLIKYPLMEYFCRSALAWMMRKAGGGLFAVLAFFFAVPAIAAAPVITGLTVDNSAGYTAYAANATESGLGSAMLFNVAFDTEVNITYSSYGIYPVLELQLDSGIAVATYSSGSGTSELTFSLSLTAADYDLQGGIVPLGFEMLEGTITGTASGVDADLTLNSVSDMSDILIYHGNQLELPENRLYAVGDTLRFSSRWRRVASLSYSGTPQMGVTIDGTPHTLPGELFDDAIVFDYTLTADDIPGSGLQTVAVDITDLQISDLGMEPDATYDSSETHSLFISQTSLSTSTVSLIESLGLTGLDLPEAGNYTEGQSLTFSVQLSSSLSLGSLTLVLDNPSQVVITSSGYGSDTSIQNFNYTIQSTDNSNSISNILLSFDGHTVDALEAGLVSADELEAITIGSYSVTDGAPSVVSVSALSVSGSYTTGDILSFKVKFSGSVDVSGTPVLYLNIGGNIVPALYVSGDGTDELIFSYQISAGINDTDGIEVVELVLNSGDITSGNYLLDYSVADIDAIEGLTVDGGPQIIALDLPADGTYVAGDLLEFVVHYDREVTISGAPVLTLAIGSRNVSAVYSGESSSTSLTFRYTVVGSDYDDDGIVISGLRADDNSIRDEDNQIASLQLPSFDDTSGIVVDGGDHYGYNAAFALQAIGPGDDVSADIVLSDIPVGVSYNYRIVSQEDNSKAVIGQGTTAASSETISNLDLSGLDDGRLELSVTFIDGSGAINSAVASVVKLVELPVITAVGAPAAATYGTAQTLTFTVDTNQAVTLSGEPTLELLVGNNTDGNAEQVSALYDEDNSSATTLAFTYQPTGETDTDGIQIDNLNLNGGTIRNIVGEDLDLTFNSLADTSGVLISDQQLSVISSVIISPSSGTLTTGDTLTFTLYNTGVQSGTALLEVAFDSGNRFTSCSGIFTLSCSYTLVEGDYHDSSNPINLVSLDLSSVTFFSGYNLSSAVSHISLSGPTIGDPTPPSISEISSAPAVAVEGDTITIEVEFSESISVVSEPALQMVIGDNTVTVTSPSVNGNTLSYDYVVQNGDYDQNGIEVLGFTSGEITDSAGNVADLSLDSVVWLRTLIGEVVPDDYAINSSNAYVNIANQYNGRISFRDAEIGAEYEIEITHNGDGSGSMSLTGTITSSDQLISSLDLSGFDDGELLITARLKNSLGTYGPSVTDTVIKDTLNPLLSVAAFDEVLINAANVSATSISYQGAEVGATYSYSISSDNGGAAVSVAGVVTAGSETIADIDLSSLEDGELSLEFTLSDAAGNTVTLGDSVDKDSTYPGLTHSVPANNAEGVAISSLQIVLTFDESVSLVSSISNGFELVDSNDVTVESFSTDSEQVSVSGNTVTLDISTTLLPAAAYELHINSGALQDGAGNGYTESSDTWLRFVTGNQAPTATGDTFSFNEDEVTLLDVQQNDVDAEGFLSTADIIIVTQPQHGGLSIDSATDAITYTPQADYFGSDNFSYRIKDSQGAESNVASVSLTLNSVNDNPVLADDSASTSEDNSLLIDVLANDSDVDNSIDSASLLVVSDPVSGTVMVANGELYYSPDADFNGSDSFTYKVADSSGSYGEAATVVINVAAVNDAPVISGTPATSVAEDSAYSFTPAGSDVDAGDYLTYSITNMPSWASFNAVTGALTGTPDNADVGTTSNIVISVSDGTETAFLAAFSIEVTNVNDAPTISGTPDVTVAQDDAYRFIPAADDVDNDTLTFSIENQPSWATFDTATGELSGTPGATDVGTDSDIVLSVTDGIETVSLDAFSIEVTNVNDAPTISGTPATRVVQDESYRFTAVAVDLDGDNLTFAIENMPAWASFNTATGALTGTPDYDDIGITSNIVIRVSDGTETAFLAAFSIEVTNVNDAPTISGTPDVTVAQDEAYRFIPAADDVDNDTLTFSIENQPSWATFDTATGELSGTPGATDVGTDSDIVLSVTDGIETVSLDAFSIEVTNVNDAPTISGTPATRVVQDESYRFTAVAVDLDGDNLTFAIENMPAWASFNTATGALTGTPDYDDIGITSNIVIRVSDGTETAFLAAFSIEVTNVNDAPTISGTPDVTVAQDEAYRFIPAADDVDNDTLTFSIENQPSWATFDTATGELSGTPGATDVGTDSDIVLSVTDGIETVSLDAFSIEVTNVNDAPTISGTPATRVVQDESYRFTAVAVDLDGDNLTFAIENMPAWASFNTATGALTGTPDYDDIGITSNIVIRVSDGTETAFLAAFSIEVTNVNDAPTISGTPDVTVAQDEAYRFIPAADDVDNDTLTFSIENQPSWATFDTATGELSGTPGATDVGTDSDIVLSVTDGIETVSLDAFSIEVTNVNDAPTISGTPATRVVQDESYRFTAVAVDLDGDNLTFAIENMPAWASFNTATGALTGTPDYDDIGITSNIVIRVSDETETAFLAAFSIEVTNVNDAPTISGTPDVTVAQDEAYRFIPAADDVDNDTLTFSIENQPSWVTFDTATGELSGTPGATDVGTDSDIVLSVTDGIETVSLDAFSIEVTNVNDAPTISGTPATRVVQDESYRFTAVAVDLDGDNLTFAIENMPAWASFNTATGALTGTPDYDDIGITSNIVIRVSDGTETAFLAAFSIEVTNVNDAPTISGTPDVTVAQDEAYRFIPAADDVDNDTLTFSIENQPSWVTFDTATGELSGTPGATDVGTDSDIVLSVTDGIETVSLDAFSIEVTNVNDAPTISGTPATRVVQDESYRFTAVAVDLDGDNLTFAIEIMPAWASFNTATGALTGTPDYDDIGITSNIVIRVSDETETAFLAAFSIEVTNVNDAPTISGTPDVTVAQDEAYRFIPAADDVDNDTLTFSIENKPSWVTFDTATGELSGTPGATDVGTDSDIVLSVTDGIETVSLDAFSIEVTNVNDAPTISGTPATRVVQDESYRFTAVAVDLDGDNLTFAIENMPAWASFNTATGALTGTPDYDDIGITSNIVIRVSDETETAFLAAFSIEVTNVNDAPTISGTPDVTVAQDEAYRFIPAADDVDNDTLTFSIENQPSWVTFDTATGELSGTPGATDVGTDSDIVLSVTDGIETVSLDAFSIEVTNVNDAPTISGTPATRVVQDESYRFTAVAVDLDGDNLTFAIENMPAWASFNTATGALTGTPDYDDIGITSNIVIRVSDGTETAFLAAFSIEVTNVNDAPTISGTPDVTVAQDEAYRFIPAADDVDNDTLTFSIENQPSWVTFDTATGELSGTPGATDVGTDSDIVLSVTDGIETVSLDAFSIEVTNVNDAPTISGTPATRVVQDESYRFTAVAVDLDGDNLTFAIENMPAWASFNTATGALTGTPDYDDIGITSNIVIRVSDETETAFLAAFSIEVTNVNDAPTISGTPDVTVAQMKPIALSLRRMMLIMIR